MEVLEEMQKVTDHPSGQNIVLVRPISTTQRSICFKKSTDIFVVHDRVLTDLHKQLDHRIIMNEEFTQNQIKVIAKGNILFIQHARKALSDLSSYNTLALEHRTSIFVDRAKK